MKGIMPWSVLSIAVLAVTDLPGRVSNADTPSQDSSLDTCGAHTLPAARAKARRLIRRIRDDLAGVENQIRNVRFVRAVEAGKAPLDKIAAIVAEEFSIVHSDINSFAQMAARFDTPGELDFWQAASEASGSPLHVVFHPGS